MRKAVVGTFAATGLAAMVGLAPAARAEQPIIVPSGSPLSVFDAFFGGAYFGGRNDGHNGYPWNTPESRPAPSVGCYFTRARVENRWRPAQVCY